MNRRNFLKALGVGAGAGVLSGALGGTPLAEALATPDRLPAPLRAPAQVAARDLVFHALNRWGFGPRPGQLEEVRTMGIEAYLEQQLDPTSIDDSALEKALGNLITLDMTPPEMQAAGKQLNEVATELIAATLARAAFSERQLFEVMVNFWTEHFSIYQRKGQCAILKTPDDREVVRKHALGKFRDLLGASAKSPAMLFYLDQAGSRKEHPNENYARELLELHTVTIGNYTEDDVKEAARALTGWTIRRLQGEYQFNRQIHDDGEKTVMGTKIPAGGGERDGEAILDMLARHPATARHIASKLCRRFIGDNPPASAIDAATSAFLGSDGDIKTVLRAIFTLPEFWNAPPKFKRPFEFTISLVRGMGAQVIQARRGVIAESLITMGHLPFQHPTPDGYSDYAADWVANMLPRWNLALAVATSDGAGIRSDVLAVVQRLGGAQTFEGVGTVFGGTLLGRPLSAEESDVLTKYITPQGNNRRALQEMVALMAGSPAFQYR